MSKSIYEEAINNTQILLALVNVKDLISKKKYDLLTQVEQALEQAQKQEKILELQKNIIKQYEMLGRTCEYDEADEVIRDECYKALRHWKKELKELENE